MDPDVCTSFAALFAGYTQAYGRYDVPTAPPGATPRKIKGRALTVRQPLTLDLYLEHLEGRSGLGVVLLNDDAQVSFAAIDYDQPIDHAQLAQRVAHLPVVVCRSKSGGAHLYVFFSPATDAAPVVQWLEELRAWLGFPSHTELFPKQTDRADSNDVGSWINLPYFGGDASTRHAVHPTDGALSVVDFCAWAARKQLATLDQLPILEPQTSLFPDGPPCLQAYEALGGFPEGMRNEGMKGVATYLKRRFPSGWQEHLIEANKVMGQLPLAEVSHLAKTYERKDYTYACTKPPLVTQCARKTCVRRLYGIRRADPSADDTLDATLDGLVCVQAEADPGGLVDAESTTWYLSVNGQRVRLTTDELYSVAAFNKACLAQIRSQPVALSAKAWRLKVNELAAVAEVQTIPYAATLDGIVWAHVLEYLQHSGTCTRKTQVMHGGVFLEDGEAHFVLHRLMEFLNARRVPYQRAERLRAILQRHGGQLYHELLDGANCPLWRVSIPTTTVSSAPTPGAPPEVIL